MAAKAAAPAEPDADDMQAHADLHTLIQHAKIKADPKRHKRAMDKHKEQQALLAAVAANAQAQQGPAGGAPGVPPAPSGPTANGGAY